MIIISVEAIPLRIPFRAGTKSDASAWGDSNLPAADSLLVKVTTDQGLVGWGEAFGFRAVASAKLAVDQLIAPLCHADVRAVAKEVELLNEVPSGPLDFRGTRLVHTTQTGWLQVVDFVSVSFVARQSLPASAVSQSLAFTHV